MGTAVIHAEEISKQYVIAAAANRGATLREAIGNHTRAAAGRLLHPRAHRAASRKPTIWALRDVSFDIQAGEVVGIIGRNGAGKSTLLKILSRITEPTSGRVRITGRVGSLLEVGTGFHPELSGRDNIYLSGSILGMRRAELERRFDEIVEFAEIGPFLDTPTKRYSSGMNVRLGFAVAAHLESEILLVDEVLAVGDLAFQRKCLGKMSDVARAGRTVLFVSHNMAVIQALCRRGIFIQSAEMHTDAPINDAVAAYLRSLEATLSTKLAERTDRRGRQEIVVERVEVSGAGGSQVVSGGPARFVFHLSGSSPSVSCRFTIHNGLGHPVAELSSAVPGPDDRNDPNLHGMVVCDVDELLLVPGRYRVDLELRSRGVGQDVLEMAAVFDIEQGTVGGRPVSADGARGDAVLRHRWTLPG